MKVESISTQARQLLYKQLQMLAEKSQKCGPIRLAIISTVMVRIYKEL